MKTIVGLFVLIALFAFHSNASAQARKLTRRIVNPNNTLRTPNAPTPPAPVPSVPAPTPPAATPAAPAQPYVAPEKTQEEKDATLRKTIEFQKQRAEAGAPSAQYDLGMRYLTGDGLEKDPALAKKWLTAASTNGNSQASKKLEELKKREAAAAPK
jgi:TPR repeat protein